MQAVDQPGRGCGRAYTKMGAQERDNEEAVDDSVNRAVRRVPEQGFDVFVIDPTGRNHAPRR